MKLNITLLFILILKFSNAQDCSDLFISEYIESIGNNNAIEIYNPTLSTIDLSFYSINRYGNGSSTSPETLQLSGFIQSGEAIVICNGQIDSVWVNTYWSLPVNPIFLSACDYTCNGIFPTPFYFNGDDAITIEKNGNFVDIFGKVGEDPGSAWTDDITAGYTDANGGTWWTKRKTLVRKSSIKMGVTQNPILFNPTAEYDSLPDATYSGMGFHSCDCIIYGCIDSNAINYNVQATVSDSSCIYAGCMDSTAINFNPMASIDDGSCLFLGCTDSLACNYDTNANVNDSSCNYLNTTINAINISCFGGSNGSILASTSGGSQNFQYSINGSIQQSNGSYNNLNAATYNINVLDLTLGCSNDIMVTLTEPPQVITNSIDTSCNFYIWDGDTINISGDYNKTYIDLNGCDSIHNINLVINNSPNTTNILGVVNVNPLQIENYSVGQNLNSIYSWVLDSGGIIINGINSNIVEVQWGTNYGTFKLFVIETNIFTNCTDTTSLVINVNSNSSTLNHNFNKKLIKITNVLGVKSKNDSQIRFYLYNDGSVEKKLIFKN